MDKKDQEIQHKLKELESTISEEPPAQLSVPVKTTETTIESERSDNSELYLLSGIALALTGFFLFLNHIQISSSLMGMFGMGQHAIGMILIVLLCGLAVLFYDYKMKVGWVLTAAACAFLFFTVLSSLVVYFTPTSVFGMLFMLLPLAAGAALIAKGTVGSKRGRKRGPG